MPPNRMRATTGSPVMVCKARHGAYKTTPIYKMILMM